jgi:hypothetical protein
MRGRGWCRSWLWLALLPGLAGCAAPEDAPAPSPPPAVAEAPDLAPATEDDSKVAALPPAPRPPDRPAPPVEPPLDPQSLKGLDQEQALGLFGRPNEIIDAAPATVWRYRGKGCRLDLFFFMDIGTRSFRALTYEFQPGDQSVTVQRACLNRLREASRAH